MRHRLGEVKAQRRIRATTNTGILNLNGVCFSGLVIKLIDCGCVFDIGAVGHQLAIDLDAHLLVGHQAEDGCAIGRGVEFGRVACRETGQGYARCKDSIAGRAEIEGTAQLIDGSRRATEIEVIPIGSGKADLPVSLALPDQRVVSDLVGMAAQRLVVQISGGEQCL